MLPFLVSCGGQSRGQEASNRGGTGGAAGDPGSGGSVSTGGAALGGSVATGGTGASSEPDADISVDLSDAYGSIWMLFSETAGAVAVYKKRNGGQGLQRFQHGGWQAELSVPDPASLTGGALASDGSAHFTFTRDAAEFETVDVFAQTLGASDQWSDAVRVGDSNIGWWQDPVIPAPLVAADASGFRMMLWSRLATQGDPTQGIVENHSASNADWTSARPIDPLTSGAISPVLTLPGDGIALAAWTGTSGNEQRALLASYERDAWTVEAIDDPVIVGQATLEVLAVVRTPDGGSRILYRRGDASGTELYVRDNPAADDFFGTLSLGTLPIAYVDYEVASAPGGRAFVTWTLYDSDAPDPCQLEVGGTFHSFEDGWSEPAPLFGGWHKIAVRSDGRAAIAYPALSRESPSTRACISRGVFVRRYAPDTGWTAPITLDSEARAITALGYAEDRLFVAWERQNRGFVKALDP